MVVQRIVPVYRPAGSMGGEAGNLMRVAGHLASGAPVFLQPALPQMTSRGGDNSNTFTPPPLDQHPVTTAIVEWIANVGPARMRVRVNDQIVPDAPILALLNKPNPVLPRSNIQAFFYRDLMYHGNAYGRWLWSDQRKARQRRPTDPPDALVPLPAENVVPKLTPDKTNLVYQHNREDYQAWEILHLRYGNDRSNILLGRSPFESVKTTLDADALGQEMIYAWMLNNIQMTLFFSLEASAAEKKAGTPRDRAKRADELIDFARKRFTAHRGGGALALGDAVRVIEVGKTADEMQLEQAHKRAETRAAAVARVAATVVGLGAGLDTGTRNQIRVQRRLSFENGVEPLQRLIGEGITLSLQPYFYPELEGTDALDLEFDNSRHTFMREDLGDLAERLRLLVGRGKDRGIISVEEAKMILEDQGGLQGVLLTE